MNDFKKIIGSKFAFVWLSQISSQLTINIMNFLLIIRLFSVTDSSIATSMLWVAYGLPAIIIGPIAAASVDMLDKRKVLLITNLFQSLVVFVYAIAHGRMVFLAYGVAMAYSLLNQFYCPAEASSVPVLVKKEQLAHANSLFFFTQQVAMISGFVLAGPLNHLLGFKVMFFVCSLMLFIAFGSVAFLPDIRPKNKLKISFEKGLFDFFEKIVEGYRLIRSENNILFPFSLLLIIQVLLAVVIVNVPTITRDIIHLPVNMAGLYVIAPTGIGSAVGAIIVPQLLKSGWRKKKIIQTAMVIFILSIVLLLINFLPFLPVFLVGLSFVGILIPAQTFLQEKTPGGMRGRIFGNFWFLVTVAQLLPVIIGGALVELFGIRTLMLLLVLIVFTILVFSRRFILKLENA